MIYKGKLYYPTFHTTNAPIARKAWACSLCGEPVQIGDRYIRYTWRRTDAIDDLPYHQECWAIVKFYCKFNDTNVFANEDVLAWLKTRRHCRLCKLAECHPSQCVPVGKWVKYKPITLYYDKLKPMPEEEPKPDETLFKILDE